MIPLLQATVLELTTLRSNYRYQSHNTDVLQKNKNNHITYNAREAVASCFSVHQCNTDHVYTQKMKLHHTVHAKALPYPTAGQKQCVLEWLFS